MINMINKYIAIDLALLFLSLIILWLVDNIIINSGLPYWIGIAIKVVIIIAFGYIIIELIGFGIFSTLSKRKGPGIKEEALAVRNLFRIFAYSILILLVLSYLNINITGFIIGAGFLSVVVGLAAQASLGNFIAGLILFIVRPFRVGDRITLVTWQYGVIAQSYQHERLIPGYEGIVKYIGFFYTTIYNEEGIPTQIPNSIMLQAMIINHNNTKKKIINLTFEVNSKVDFSQLRDKLYDFITLFKGVNISKNNIYIVYIDHNAYRVGVKFIYEGEPYIIKSAILNFIKKFASQDE